MSDAYKWLHTLPPNVRDEMKSMEHVVVLYLKAKRLGVSIPSKEDLESLKVAASSAAPSIAEPSKNSQEFQKTLKNLKTELDRFDFNPAAPEAQLELQKPTDQIQQTSSFGASVAPPVQADPPNILSALRMDPRSRQIVTEIRDGLNLSSDIEVLRMSLVLAHKTLRDLVK
jgi:hypothetical protein